MIGCWIIGAGGCVASSAVALHALVKEGVVPPTGMLTAQDRFSHLFDEDIVFGGHEIAPPQPQKSFALVMQAAQRRELIPYAEPHLKDYAGRIKQGFSYRQKAEGTLRDVVGQLADDIDDFRRKTGAGRVVVLNLATTEPQPESVPQDEAEMEAAFDKGRLPESAVYALAACEAGCAYVNFTPSVGCYLPPVKEKFEGRSLPYAGRDGKTGETLIKTALAHLFSVRAFNVLSWVGFNILGNPDGKSLSEPHRKAAKCATKGATLQRLLGYSPDSLVGIEFVKPLGDKKIAWDHILFEGAFGTRMSLSFLWEGVDSVLAAPIVIDLVRFAALALKRGESGYLEHLALFFKDVPPDAPQHLLEQFHALLNYVEKVRSGGF
ncbi:MAG: myo-inositol-1-phosphate synthase [Planctomycetota bacterium]|mgnify:CR=1 FL=1|nr:MAG: myo-inositol-1-phosphate synthase [Planctomycetota bacterium]